MFSAVGTAGIVFAYVGFRAAGAFAEFGVPIAFVVSSLIVYWTTWPYTGYSLIAFLVGLAIFFIARSRGKYPISDVRRGIWIVTYSLALSVLSYLRSYGIGVIQFPVDFFFIGALAPLCFYWGVRSSYKTGDITRLVEQERIEISLDEIR